MNDQDEGYAMKINSPNQDRETMMQESREARLMLWDLLRLRYPEWELTERPIAVDEILPELRHVFNIFHLSSRKSTFKIWQRMRLWPPPEIVHDCRD
jgi:hypothetical protein